MFGFQIKDFHQKRVDTRMFVRKGSCADERFHFIILGSQIKFMEFFYQQIFSLVLIINFINIWMSS
jgi:hypothetical protein